MFRSTIAALFFRRLFLLVWIGLAASLLPGTAFSSGAVCAQVKIQIKQKVNLERQAFNAAMRIENGLEIPITNIGITLNFADANGNGVIATTDANDAAAAFFLAAPTLVGIDAIDGSGSIAAKTDGEIDWLIIPAPGAGGALPQGTLYYVGATLNYTMGSESKTVAVTPDTVLVRPQPLLKLDYFLAGDVYADDPFTPEVEPPVPFTFGVRAKNIGGGIAKAMTIESAQPKIVENRQGLLIGFQIVDSYVNDQPAAKTLLLPLGDILPGTAAIGRWRMVTSLDGQFTDIVATFTHADALGGALTSLIKQIDSHLLVHDVNVDLPGRDGIRDFLARDGTTLRVYESDSVDTEVIDQSAAARLQADVDGTYLLALPATTGFAYARMPDPMSGRGRLGNIVRSDGKTIPAENAWFSRTRNQDLSWSYFLNIFDADTSGNYRLGLSAAAGSTASLAGIVYRDSNGNGQQDSGEAGLGAVPLALSGTDEQGRSIAVDAYTEPGGDYRFVDLPAGTYRLRVGILGGYSDGAARAGSAGGTAGAGEVSDIVLAAGTHGTGYAFGKLSGAAQPVDLALTMRAGASSAKVGDTVRFALTVTNAGPATAVAVEIRDQLPAGLSWVGASASGGSYDAATGIWTPGSIAPAASATLEIVARVTQAGTLVNTATVTTGALDVNTANNTASATVLASSGNSKINIGVLAGDSRAASGVDGRAQIVVDNVGDDPAYGVAVRLAPAGLTVGAITVGRGGYDPATAVWTIDSLAAGESASLAATLTGIGASATLTAMLEHIDGQPAISPIQGQAILNPGTNPDACHCGDLAVAVSADAATAGSGAIVEWTVRAGNRGPSPAVDAYVDAPLPGNAVFIDAIGRGNYDAVTGRWAIGTLYEDDAATLTLRSTLQNSLEARLTGAAGASGGRLPYTDLVRADDTATAAVNPTIATADLRIDQTSDKSRIEPGDTVTLVLRAENSGFVPVDSVRVFDLLPAGLTYVGHRAGQGSYDPDTGLWRIGSLADKARATLEIDARVLSASTLVNVAFIAAERTDGTLGNNVSRLFLNRASADIALTLIADNRRPAAGQTATLTLTASNSGPDPAQELGIGITLPPALTLAAIPAGYDQTSGIWSPGILPANSSVSLVLPVVAGNADPAVIIARLQRAVSRDPHSDNNQAVLELNSLTGGRSRIAGTVFDDLDGDGARNASEPGLAGITVTLDGADYRGTAVNRTLDTDAGGDFEFAGLESGVYAVRVAAANGYANTGAAAGSAGSAGGMAIAGAVTAISLGIDADAAGYRFAQRSQASLAADLGIALSTDNHTPLLGDNVQIVAVVANAGPAGASGVVANLPLPGGLNYVAASATAGSFDPVAGVWTIGDLASGGNARLTITAAATASVMQNVNATVGSSAADTNQANNRANLLVTPMATADLAIAIDVASATPQVGGTVAVTVAVVNHGPATAAAVAASIALPTGWTAGPALASVGSYDPATAVWTLGDLANGAGGQLSFDVRVGAEAPATVGATVSSGTADIVAGNNAVGFHLNPLPAADLAVALQAGTLKPGMGQTFTLTAGVSNAGPSTAVGARLALAVPGSMRLVAVRPGTGDYDAGSGIWTIGNLASQAGAILELDVQATGLGAIAATATATAVTDDPVVTNNTASLTLNPVALADLAIAIGASSSTPRYGDSAVLTLTVTNRAGAAATGIKVADHLPPGLELVAANASLGNYDGASGIWMIGTLPVAGSASLRLTVKVTALAAVTYSASVDSDAGDPNPANNVANIILTPVAADLGITLTTSNPTPREGDMVTATIVVGNGGPSAAVAVKVATALPAGLARLSIGASTGSFDGKTGVWSVGTLAKGANATLTLTLRVTATGRLTVSANGATATADPNPANDAAAVSLEVTPISDLSIGQSVNQSKPKYGETVTFTIKARNGGPSSADPVTVAALLPTGLVHLSSSAGQGSYDPGSGQWTVGKLASGASAALWIMAKVATADPLIGLVTIASANPDPQPGNNQASVTLTPLPAADLDIGLEADTLTPTRNGTVVFTVRLINSGPSPSSATTVALTLPPASLNLITAVAGTGTYSAANSTWKIGNLAPGSEAKLTLTMRVTRVNALTVDAKASGGVYDPDSGNNSVSLRLTPLAARAAREKTATGLWAERRDLLVWIACPDGGVDAAATACAAERADFLDAYLGRIGVAHEIVTERADFLNAVRCGRHNAYWLSGIGSEAAALPIGELRAALIGGGGILIDGVTADAGILAELARTALTGQAIRERTIIVDGDVDGFEPVGPVAALQTATGTVIARFRAPAVAAAVADGRDLGGSVIAGFDLLAALRSATPGASALLAETLDYLWPVAATDDDPRPAVVTAVAELQNLSLSGESEAVVRDTAVNALRAALDAPQPEVALAAATLALEALNALTGTDAATYRLAVARWLRQLERPLCVSPAQCAGVGAPRADFGTGPVRSCTRIDR